MSLRRAKEMEAELRMWWMLSREAHQCPTGHDLEVVVEEMEAVMQYTQWPKLRHRIATIVETHRAKKAAV